ncbi:RagB/SusD family nutrient uptake outer membrane protein [Algibacter mikhailovii]|uniref:Membrane protein n=1 Tax=Algibacter mikhailovii TaxID=425498 RepID=A0A918R728_9FLAO|nr:RagB/SusD family nutrient uptake outer membrane protein [Algibacter mikhailovii]GGZ86131.1 membrane protein [Algibacter mikhailovii]
MKKIKFLCVTCVVLFLALISVSCSELDVEPKGQFTPDTFFTTQADLDGAVAGLYRPLVTHSQYTQIALPAMGGDDLTSETGGNKANFAAFDTYKYDPTINWLNEFTWTPMYQLVYRANTIINSYQNIEASTERDQAAAQAFFMRGMAYFTLIKTFGDVPLILGAPTGEELRSPIVDVYAQIYKDLQFAESVLPNDWGDEPGRPTKWAAKSFLAKAYLYNAGWPLKDESKYALAASKSLEILNGSGHQLVKDYKDLWQEETNNNSESVFAVQYCESCNAWDTAGWWLGTTPAKVEGGWGDFFSEIAYFEEFPEGPRKDATFQTEFYPGIGFAVPWDHPTLGPGHPYFAKWRSGYAATLNEPAQYKGSSQNIYLMRYADPVLIYAEAANMSGGANAEEWVNKIRRRAAGLPIDNPNASVDLSGLSQQELHDAIIEERKWEFGGEWDRFFDMVRNGLVQKVADKRALDTRETPINPNPGTDFNYSPIPSTEILFAPQLTQNPCCD